MEASISITNKCNLKCKMCDIGQQNFNTSGLIKTISVSELNVNDWVKIFQNNICDTVNIISVEPLLYGDLENLLKNIPGKINITTNGWLIMDKIDILEKYCNMITVSIDGLQETHDEIRGVVGSYARALKGLISLKEKGKSVRVSYAITPYNLEDIDKIYKMMNSKGIPVVFNHYNFIHELSARQDNCLPANPMEDLDKMNTALLYEKIKLCNYKNFNPPIKKIQSLNEYYKTAPVVRIKKKCRIIEEIIAGKRIAVSTNGDFIIGHRCWIDADLGNAINGKLDIGPLKAISKDINKNGLCSSCQRLCCAGKTV